ncbi:MAG: hypothetical protein GF307_00245 [candidate division Zixibacteria bacterium]|nr:hypothetical protein [candidate division Zixibacteria bacterium]
MAEFQADVLKNNEDINELREDVAKLRSDLKTLIDNAKEAGLKNADDTRSKVKHFVSGLDEKVRESVGDTYENVLRQGNRAVSVSRETVQEKPLATVLASFFAGVVVGRLILK